MPSFGFGGVFNRRRKTSSPFSWSVFLESFVMVELDLGKSADNAGDFLILRAKAIDEYAQLEQAMAFLFAALARTERDVASLIFFRITNASSRNRIIEDLIKRRFGDACNHFWFGIPKLTTKKAS